MANFKPTVLYIMQHTITKKKYFGKTVRIDDSSYIGSGTYWQNHCKKYGKQHVIRLWRSEIFFDKEECKDFALSFSELFDIMNSDEWANIIPEDGMDGHAVGYKLDEEVKNKISKSLTGKPNPKTKYTIKEDLEIRSERCSTNNKGRIWVNNEIEETKCFPNEIPPRDSAQQRGFSTAVRPDQHRHFLLRDRKGDIINDDFFLIARREVLQNQSRLFCVVSHVNANVIKKAQQI